MGCSNRYSLTYQAVTPPVYRLKTGCCGSRLPNCVKNGTLGGSKPNGSPSPISALSRSPAPAPASGRACSAARATALAASDESIEKIVAVSQHIRKNSVDLKIFLVFFSLDVTVHLLPSHIRLSHTVPPPEAHSTTRPRLYHQPRTTNILNSTTQFSRY